GLLLREEVQHPGGGVAIQWIDVDDDRVMPTLRQRPPVGQRGAGGRQHDYGLPGVALEQRLQHAQYRSVGPVQVGQHEHQRRPAGGARGRRAATAKASSAPVASSRARATSIPRRTSNPRKCIRPSTTRSTSSLATVARAASARRPTRSVPSPAPPPPPPPPPPPRPPRPAPPPAASPPLPVACASGSLGPGRITPATTARTF